MSTRWKIFCIPNWTKTPQNFESREFSERQIKTPEKATHFLVPVTVWSRYIVGFLEPLYKNTPAVYFMLRKDKIIETRIHLSEIHLNCAIRSYPGYITASSQEFITCRTTVYLNWRCVVNARPKLTITLQYSSVCGKTATIPWFKQQI